MFTVSHNVTCFNMQYASPLYSTVKLIITKKKKKKKNPFSTESTSKSQMQTILSLPFFIIIVIKSLHCRAAFVRFRAGKWKRFTESLPLSETIDPLLHNRMCKIGLLNIYSTTFSSFVLKFSAVPTNVFSNGV